MHTHTFYTHATHIRTLCMDMYVYTHHSTHTHAYTLPYTHTFTFIACPETPFTHLATGR